MPQCPLPVPSHLPCLLPRSVLRQLPWSDVQQVWDVRNKVLAGERPDILSACLKRDTEERCLPVGFARLAQECWDGVPDRRPLFADAVDRLKSMRGTLGVI